jgi:ligand-binding SRPBCC domain-containing protein
MVTTTAHTFSDVMDAPLDEVFAWHTRPGAFARLTPPWAPARVEAEAASLGSGQGVLALPGGLRWVARHDPAAYDPPRQFADELASLPLSAVVPWRHVHEFAEAGLNSTRVTDRVFTQFRARCCGRCSATGTGSSLVTWPHTNGLARFATGP